MAVQQPDNDAGSKNRPVLEEPGSENGAARRDSIHTAGTPAQIPS